MNPQVRAGKEAVKEICQWSSRARTGWEGRSCVGTVTCVCTAMALCEDLELVHPLVHGTAEEMGGFLHQSRFYFLND